VRVQSKDVARLASKRQATVAGSVKMPEGVGAPEKMGPDVFNSTYYPRGEDTDNSRKPWIVIDAAGLRLGRLSTLVATYLRGGNVATYSPSMNMGTYVVIVNAEQVVVSGNKFEDKLYKRHTTGRPGAMKTETFRALQGRIPERIIEKAVRGMLPKNRLGRELFTQLKVYAGSEHPHAAQNPADVTAEVKERCYSSSMVQ
jgi:large subunit ribosomal protein L13